jgi:phosphatidate phosphatase APP1
LRSCVGKQFRIQIISNVDDTIIHTLSTIKSLSNA